MSLRLTGWVARVTGLSGFASRLSAAVLARGSAKALAGLTSRASQVLNAKASWVRGTSVSVDSAGKPLRRPYLRKATRQSIQDAAPKTIDGKFIDPNTGQIIEGKFHYGHTYGHEHRRLKAEAKGWTQKEFNDYINDNPHFFQIEDPISNMSHKYEKPGG